MYDSVFRNGQGLAIGSIGQYPGVFEFIENFYAKNITVIGTSWAIYIKTWTGVEQNYPPNGGGGGLGYAKNIYLEDVTHVATRGGVQITQCTSFSGASDGCDTSKFQVSNLYWKNLKGTTLSEYAAELQCSGDAPCPGVEITNVDLVINGTNTTANQYSCSHVVDPIGFNCTADAE